MAGPEDSSNSLSSYRLVFILAQLLHGAGRAPLIALGTTFMDDSVSPRSSPLYIALFQMWFVIGPAIGYVLGGELLLLHTDLVRDSGITPTSSLWVGAWWPGFILAGVLALVAAFFIHLYPASINTKRDTSVRQDGEEGDVGFLQSLRSLLTNPTYMLLAFGSGGDGAILAGLSAFLPKFIEQQYGLSNGQAAQLVGLIVVPAGGLGTFLGGWVIKRFNLDRGKIILMCISFQFITLPFMMNLLMSCPAPTYASLTSTATVSTPRSDCRAACDCPSLSYDPVCGSDSVMYLSPCHAGCSVSAASNFTDCACVDGGSAIRANCTTECNYLVPFCIVSFLVVFMTFLLMLPLVIACMRAVERTERSLAVGLQTCLWRLVGAIPGPIAFGYFVDRTCILWDKDCGRSE